MKNRMLGIALAICTLLALAGCREKINIPVAELTEDGYFTLRESREKGRYGPVVIFPERHNSRLIQAEIGWALNILLEQRGINSVALEGMYEGETMTGVKLPYSTDIAKYTALLAVLEQGSIKAPEFMYLAKDSFVFGIENKDEYAIDISDDANRAFVQSLLMSIAVDQSMELLESYLQRKDIDLDTLLALNPWTKETFEIISKSGSITAINSRLQELETKTGNLLNARTKPGFKELKEFYKAAHQRSFTMAGNVYNKLRKKNEPLTMIIGAAHTEDITGYFNKKKVSYYVLEPSGLNAANIWSDLTNDEYKQKNAGSPVFINKQIGSFFEDGRNSRPTYDSNWVRKQLDLTSLLSNLINMAPAWPPKEGFSPNMLSSNELRIIPESIDVSNPADIKCSMINNKGQQLYIRMVKNIQNCEFGSLNKAFAEMIARLERIDGQDMSYEQRLKLIESVIEVFNFAGHAIYISPDAALFKIDIT